MGGAAPKAFFAYLLRCGDRSYYAGYTVDPARRLRAHRLGRASRYTRAHRPVGLAAVWRCPTLGAALRLERLLKAVPHAVKWRLAEGGVLTHIVPEARALGARRVPARVFL